MLEGRLGDFTLPDILRLLAFTAKSGRLHVSTEQAEARVDVLEGRIRDASTDVSTLGLARRLVGQDLLAPDVLARTLEAFETMPTDLELARHLAEDEVLESGLLADLVREQLIDALFGLLRWEDGAFRFEAVAGEARGPSVLDLALTVDDALDEVGRRLEAHAAVEERTGHPDAVVTIRRPGRERAEVGLSPEGWTLLSMIDGHRTVAELVRLSGQGEYRTRRTLASLMDEGIVSVGDASEPSPAERLVQAHRTIAEHEARLLDRPASDGDLAVDVPVAPPAEAASAPPAEPVGEPEPAAEPAEVAPEPVASPDAPGVTPLRARARKPQLRTDPEVDEDLIHRLIDGVENL